MQAVELSVVSPVYQAAPVVDELVRRLHEQLGKLVDSYEIILVEDGSRDASWQKIEAQCRADERVVGIKLSRNFGQHRAITAGLQASRGQYVVVMDCDLQDDPAYLPQLYQKAREGYHIVYTRKQGRQHSWWKNLWARLFFFIFNLLTDYSKADAQVGAYSLLSRKVVDAFLRIKDAHRHYLLILKLLGFSHTYLDIQHQPRYAGKTSYTFGKMFRHALDGITSQSAKLLHLAVVVGFGLFVISILAILFLVYKYYNIGAEIGWTSIMVTIVFSTGLIMMAIGVLGLYLGKIFEQVKERPLYFIEQRLNG
jgi:glycosyltransferase involved in cell wall biosynthesis